MVINFWITVPTKVLTKGNTILYFRRVQRSVQSYIAFSMIPRRFLAILNVFKKSFLLLFLPPTAAMNVYLLNKNQLTCKFINGVPSVGEPTNIYFRVTILLKVTYELRSSEVKQKFPFCQVYRDIREFLYETLFLIHCLAYFKRDYHEILFSLFHIIIDVRVHLQNRRRTYTYSTN